MTLTTRLPEGRLRISEAVLDKMVIAEAQQVPGVVDVHGWLLGAALGSVAGSVVGFVEGGPIGAVVGGTMGSALGATAGHLIEQHRDQRRLFEVGKARPSIRLRLTGAYGADLRAVAASVRQRVRETVTTLTGLDVARVDVEFVEIAPPARSL
ncbi:Asp23/Gls24 family envelope stress response protein [Rhodocaloribacter litoris]|uniref:Asp23/Gls24 family envelope stress response protein n=1 Tax=Rhodocaloribacter litoris TaxID=2558931 RepID=UPI0014209C26|nr:Asp23/Gls24 family envelope stress response protein [Rhodocaloribacter litoris]QXD16851.1 Asp23/Gls24 family envelope stress response protein [Rhodocaloribacter litoris]GIV60492.1 MAG: hypothetical protein KatS3mg043_1581 [Rhodothermaceae bacterium]